MERKPQRGGPSPDRDGVRVVYRERAGLRGGVLLVAITLLVVLAGFLFLRRAHSASPTAVPEPRERIAVVPESARVPARAGEPDGVTGQTSMRTRKNPMLARHAIPGRGPRADVARVLPDLESAGGGSGKKTQPVMDAGEFIAALRESGETAGLAAFSPPGTRPPRSGVIVPADYQLPEGFARHYQTTDDGRQLAPVLVVAPGYEILDDAGDPVALMDDRIVPPEYAPPDLPVQMLEVPSEHDPGREAP